MTAYSVLLLNRRASRLRSALPATLALVALALLAAGLFGIVNRRDNLSAIRQLARAPASSKAAPLGLPNLVRPLTPDEAIKENQDRPFNALPDTPAQKFHLRTDQNSRDRAIECLAQAVYYEAGAEGVDGQRAVAEVVLNRMRHPGFPSTVCGVVYQGSELPTGCQFTFTCDGSLAQAPIASVWAEARRIAIQALDGRVFAPVGHATHYHADYVLPYWADSLAKQVQIGHHIFYRLKGGLGSSSAFVQRYAGKEPDLPPLPSTVAVATEAVDQAQALLDSGLAGPPPLAADVTALAARRDEPTQIPLADSSKGVLLIDQAATVPVESAKQRRRDDCSSGSSKQILPTTPNDLHSGSTGTGC